MRKSIILLVLILTCGSLSARFQTKIDSLQNLLKSTNENQRSVIFNKLSKISTSHKDALKFANKALLSAQKTNNKEEELKALSNIGFAYYTQNKYYNAIEHYLLSLKIGKELNSKYEVAEIYNKIGRLYKYLSDYYKALEYSLK